jgi:hypothetical protein
MKLALPAADMPSSQLEKVVAPRLQQMTWF